MEINKGPDLNAKDERDKQVKLQVQRDIFRIVDPDDDLDKEKGDDYEKELKEIVKKTRFVKVY